MAAPTDVYVEGTSITTTKVWWTYPGAALVGVYRSTDGVAYTLIANVAAGTAFYADSGLAADTKYWYKLSDDAGSTFSSVVTTYTHACVRSSDGSRYFSLPRYNRNTKDKVVVEDLNETMQRIEDVVGKRVLAPEECVACPSDGQLTIDCSSGCSKFLVIADTDINSIGINTCDAGDIDITFVVPPNTTRKICGWPAGFGFGGDECRKMPYVTGASGGSITVNSSGGNAQSTSSGRNSYNKGGSGGGASGAVCTCVAVNGALTIKSCNANNSVDCASSKKLNLKVCGGKAPYTWSKTGTITIAPTTGAITMVTVPANAGSGVAGTAYIKQVRNCNTGGGCTGATCTTANPAVTAQYGCNDQLISCGAYGGANCATPDSVASVCCPTPTACTDGSLSCPNFLNTDGYQCQLDTRTGPMIAANCEPCGIHAGGSTVSVLDANGVTATIILRP